MRRREFIVLVGGAAVAWLPTAQARQPDRIARIGYLIPWPRSPFEDEFSRGLRDLGWVEGENIHIEFRSAEGHDARLPTLAAEMVDLNVDVIVTAANGVFAARSATAAIPIVVAAAPDLEALGFVASLAHPGGNLTGQTFFLPQLVAKRLEFLKSVAPSLTRAGVVMYRGSAANAEVMRVVSLAAKALSVELRPIELGGLDELESAFPPAPLEAIGGFVSTDHPLFVASVALAVLAQKRGLAWVGAPISAAGGTLIGYGVDFSEMFRHAAVFVDKILKGAKPGDIPIEQATKFKTVVNLKTAKALGLEIPPTLLAGADEVIE